MNWKSGLQKLSVWPPARRLHDLAVRLPVLGPALKRLTARVVPRETRVWVEIPSGLGKGLALHLDPRFEMDYATGTYELHLQKALAEHLQAGAVFYDVGAHIGVVSMFAGGLVGSTGSIFAFEGDPENAKRIEAHARRNNLEQIQTLSCVVWSSTGQLSFERASAESSRNQGSVAAGSGRKTENVIVVDAITLDNFAQGHRPPSLIKIDVEGGEAEVLRGSEQIFSRTRPVVICEVHHKEAEVDVCKWLTERGYSLKWLGETVRFPCHLLGIPLD